MGGRTADEREERERKMVAGNKEAEGARERATTSLPSLQPQRAPLQAGGIPPPPSSRPTPPAGPLAQGPRAAGTSMALCRMLSPQQPRHLRAFSLVLTCLASCVRACMHGRDYIRIAAPISRRPAGEC